MPNTTEKPLPPTPEQIITLHGLTREIKHLARQINHPFNSLIVSTAVSAMQLVGKENAYVPTEALVKIGYFIESCLEPIEPTVIKESIFHQLFMISTLVIGFYVLCYQLWQASSALTLKLFPNGVGMEKKQHTTANIQKTLTSQNTARASLIELRKFIAQQRSLKNGEILLGFGIFVLLPLILYGEKTRIDVYIDIYGPTISFGARPKETSRILFFPQLIFNVVQRSVIYNQLYNLWLSYNTPKQLKKYLNRLAMLNFSNQEWKMKTGDSKSSAMFELDLSTAAASIDKLFDGSKQLELSLSKFAIELYCILIKENIPALLSENDKIYVGYTDINDAKMLKIKGILENKIRAAALQEKDQQNILLQLTHITKQLKTPSLQWDFFNSLGENGLLEKFYYCDIKSLPKLIIPHYVSALGLITPDVILDETILTLGHVPADPALYNLAEKNFLENIKQYSLESKTTNLPNTKHKQKNKIPDSENTETKKIAPTAHKNKVLPKDDDVEFSYGVRIPNNEEKPDSAHTAFELHVPWLPEGRAWGSIDTAIFDEVKEYLSSARILSRLEIGEIHGTHQSNKTKVGAVGIQTTDESYQTIHGENVEVSTFKIKDSNIRIFARKLETVTGTSGKPYVHYRFDGWDFGH